MYSVLCSLYEGCESTIRLGPALDYTRRKASSAAFAMEGAMERMTASTPLVELADGWKVNHAAREQDD